MNHKDARVRLSPDVVQILERLGPQLGQTTIRGAAEAIIRIYSNTLGEGHVSGGGSGFMSAPSPTSTVESDGNGGACDWG